MTSNEVAHRDEPATDLTVAAEQPDGLIAWAHRARQAHQIAKSLANTSFVPASMKGKPEEVTAAILAGDELGLKPMASLRSVDIIAGTPALRAHAMRGLVQSRGHEVELVESDDTHCVMRGRRHPGGYHSWQTVTWTIERAKRMGLVDKPEWKKQPQTMLVARATGEICRLIASDVLYAVPYAVEELDRDERPAVEPQRPVTRAEITGEAEPETADDSDDKGDWSDVEVAKVPNG